MRRERPSGLRLDVGPAVETQIEQPSGKEFEYRIITVNKAGDAEPSNTIVVL